jgi:Ca2+-binding RTX toxin-like protein
VVSGGDGDDTLRGLAGNDTLDGGSGTNTLDGGAGDDTYVLHAGSSDTIIEAADGGVDTVKADFSYALGTGLENLILLLAGNLNGTGNELGNVMTGNAGSNTLLGMAGNDTLYGGDGNDTLDGGTGADTMTGGAGDDTYKVDNAADRIVELASGGTDAVLATISCKLGNFVEVLTLSGTDNLKGTGNTLDNTIYGNAGNNVLVGNAGDDSLYGGDGKDTLNGGDGADTLIGCVGNDSLTGGAGPDLLDGGEGADKMTGGAGNDVYLVDNPHDKTIESADGGTDTVQASINWTLSAQVEKLTLIGGNLNGSGNANDNTITGTLGNNALKGNAGDDIIFGNDGNDKLYGGAGKDTLTGGAGKDSFVFDTAPAGSDTITDFSRAEGDKIQLSRAVFAGLTHLGALTADEFYSANGAQTTHDASDRVIYDTASGKLYYDADGQGGAAAVQFAVLGSSNHPVLIYSDIQIIA